MGSGRSSALQIVAGRQQRFRALGRLKQGEKNKTEQRYEDQVLKPALHRGDILWYRHEGIKLRLADRTFLTVDYAVLPASGVLEMHDVKGAPILFQEDAKVKMKVAAEEYPFVFKVAYPIGRTALADWKVEEI